MDVVSLFSFMLLMVMVGTFAETNRERPPQRPGRNRTIPLAMQPQVIPEDVQRSPESETLKQLLQDPGYNKEEPPLKDRPTGVKLGIYVISFYTISETTMDYQVSMYFRQAWVDARLKFDPIKATKDTLRMGDNSWKMVWTPDTYIRNEKRASFHDVTVNNRMLTLRSDGRLWYSSKITATLSCQMRLQKYPMDTQLCPMMFESFGYTMDTLFFQWLDDPVVIAGDVELPQFSLVDKHLIDCSQNYTAGAFSCKQIDFVLRRDIGYFLIQVYIPTILIVILSWVSFWINTDAIPARVSLGLLTVLTMTTQSTGANAALPRVSYIKAIDVWMSTCLVFVFSGLLEFAVVNVVSRKGVRTINPVRRPPPPPPVQKYDDQQIEQINLVEIGKEREHGQTERTENEAKLRARRIDKISRKFFPMIFLLFNIVYWVVYSI